MKKAKPVLGAMLSLLCFLFINTNAQTSQRSLNSSGNDKGIKWMRGFSWEQIKQKAKADNKYIFMDCFATWCGPCKAMDKYVYSNDTIGALMNTSFISVRLQMDSTKNDNEETRKWYVLVKSIAKEYSVNAFPTFLFFAPNGEIVHKDVGAKTVKQFTSLINNVPDPNRQYYTLINQYKEGKLDYTILPALANMARTNNGSELAFEMARRYMTDYLDRDNKRYFVKDNQKFIYSFYGMLKSSDPLFNYYVREPALMDSLLGKPGRSQKIADYVITKDEITPSVSQVKEENNEKVWKKIANNIRKKYGGCYAERTVLNAKVDFYKEKKDWPHYSKYLVRKVQMEKRQGLPSYISASSLNDYAWDIFLYSNRKIDLKKALQWSKRSLQLIDSFSFNVGPDMDTKANLLYKLGKTKTAIKQEEEALNRIITDAEKFTFIKSSIEGYQKTLQEMENGQPTSIESGAIWSIKSKKRIRHSKSLLLPNN